MLRRKIYDQLMNWKFQKNHKCLIVRGERQVGKTFIIEEFGKTYSNFIELNFIKNASLKQIFEGDLDGDSVISKMKLYFDPSLFVPGETLIFLDEIQDCKRARTSLKFLKEQGKYDVICSGSNLGIERTCDEDDEGYSVSSGSETTLLMYGLDFEEFLWATGIGEEAIENVKKDLKSYRPLQSAHYSTFSTRFRDYMVVGGMPEAVQTYVNSKDYTEARRVIMDLVDSAKGDINRYNKGVDRIKTIECYDSIPYQLDQTNKKFMYSRITGEGSRKSAEKYMDNLLWIKASGYANFCYSLNGFGNPLKRMADKGTFRAYLSDTGTLTNIYGTKTVQAILSSDYSFNMGAITENVVAECLSKSGFEIYYYNRTNGPNRMEIDFIIESDSGTVAIEVKSGKTRESPSIKKLENPVVSCKIMLRDDNIDIAEQDIKGYPLFAAAFLKEVLS